jgi:hypothetical protein
VVRLTGLGEREMTLGARRQVNCAVPLSPALDAVIWVTPAVWQRIVPSAATVATEGAELVQEASIVTLEVVPAGRTVAMALRCVDCVAMSVIGLGEIEITLDNVTNDPTVPPHPINPLRQTLLRRKDRMVPKSNRMQSPGCGSIRARRYLVDASSHSEIYIGTTSVIITIHPSSDMRGGEWGHSGIGVGGFYKCTPQSKRGQPATEQPFGEQGVGRLVTGTHTCLNADSGGNTHGTRGSVYTEFPRKTRTCHKVPLRTEEKPPWFLIRLQYLHC